VNRPIQFAWPAAPAGGLITPHNRLLVFLNTVQKKGGIMTTFETFNNVVPAGQYSATFESVDSITGPWGDRLQWTFEVTDGEHSGAIASAFSGAERASVKSNLGRYLAMLEGDEPRAGISRDPDAYIGKPYTITVTEGDGGSTKVTDFKPCEATVVSTESRDESVPF
jgi:hypothetical protein